MNPLDKRHGEPKVNFYLFGTPAINCQERPFTLPRRQARALLFRLAVNRQPVPREHLADLLWPDKPPATARRNLTRLLSYLRGQLPQPDLLQVGKTAVSLHPYLATSDVVQFTRLCAADNPSEWETAVSLYRGPFLAGFTLNDSPEFDNWMSREQRQLERLYLEALWRLAVLPTQKPAAAIHFARLYLDTDDLAEEMHRQLITLYAASGDRSAALRQYETCVVVLERELGVPPLPETRAAYEAARDGRQLSAPQKAPAPEWATLPGLDLPLIGREAVWDTMAKVYGRFRSGGVIFISGEPGVGKSRLMQEFASAQPGWVLTGNSHADGRTIPYQPLIQALRQALSFSDRWRAAPIWLAEAARLLPELPTVFPGLPLPMEVEPEQAQARLFEALTQLFHSLAADAPLLLCLDDVHWADEATRGWLQYVVRRLSGSQLCIIATYRTQEAAVLDEWRRTLGRAHLKADVPVAGLAAAAVASLLRQASENDVEPARLAPRIHAATGGNAFFVLEIVRELLETNQLTNPPSDLPLPATVRETVLRRVGRLTPLAQQILEITAVLSPLLTFPFIHQAAGRGDMETAVSLEELATHQLLLADDDQFHFQHDLVREAVYQNISSWRRQLLHRRAAAVLTMVGNQKDAGWAAATAVHFAAAGEAVQAIAAYRQAADAAQSLYAHQEAINYLQRAIELAQESGGKTAVLPYLHEALADNLAIAGEFTAAETAYHVALALMPEDEPLLSAALERKLGATLPTQQRYEEAETVYRTALARLDALPPTAVTQQHKSIRLNILLGLGDALYFQTRSDAMMDLMEQAQALLAEVGTVEQQSNYYSRLDQIAFTQNRWRVSAKNLKNGQTALTLAQKSGNVRLIARQQFHLGFQLLWYDNLSEAEEYLRQSLMGAEALGDFWLQDQCLVYLNILYRLQGNTAQVAAQLPHLIEISQAVGYSNYIGVAQANAAWLHYRAGEWQQAQTQAAAAVATWGNSIYPFHWPAHWLLLALALKQNCLADAIASACVMSDIKQQKLPDEIDDLLLTAVSAHEMNDQVTARDCLETAVALATQHGYL